MKYEDFLGDGMGLHSDDTAANSLQVQCRAPGGGDVFYLEPAYDGNFGEWKRWIGADWNNEFVKKVATRFDNSFWGDQSGINGISFDICRFDVED